MRLLANRFRYDDIQANTLPLNFLVNPRLVDGVKWLPGIQALSAGFRNGAVRRDHPDATQLRLPANSHQFGRRGNESHSRTGGSHMTLTTLLSPSSLRTLVKFAPGCLRRPWRHRCPKIMTHAIKKHIRRQSGATSAGSRRVRPLGVDFSHHRHAKASFTPHSESFLFDLPRSPCCPSSTHCHPAWCKKLSFQPVPDQIPNLRECLFHTHPGPVPSGRARNES